MSTANITIPQLGSTQSPATHGGPKTTAWAGEAAVGEKDTNLGQLLRIARRGGPVEWWAARRGRTAPLSSVDHGARR
jgi:hypothetical protein